MTATTAETPPLESGDRLTPAGFHRRNCARPDLNKAELGDRFAHVTTWVTAPHGTVLASPTVKVADRAQAIIRARVAGLGLGRP